MSHNNGSKWEPSVMIWTASWTRSFVKMGSA